MEDSFEEKPEYQSDWWILEKINHISGGKFSDEKNISLTKNWQISGSSISLLILALIILAYGVTYKEAFSNNFPNTTAYTKTLLSSINIIPNFLGDLGDGGSYDLIASMVYLKQINSQNEGSPTITETPSSTFEKPLYIKIAKIGVSSKINNPTSININTLNESLNSGAVRYPNSGLLGENKNVFIFGHSTSLQTDKEYYKTFNGLEKLEKGDEIKIESSKNIYTYKVTSVKKTNTSEGAVRIDTDSQKLTLSTCNTLGAEEDRFVVEADFSKKEVKTSNTNQTNNNLVIPTAGNEEEREYQLNLSNTVTAEYGLPDLEATINKIGFLDENQNFVATSTLQHNQTGAVTFTVKNIGTKTSDNWTFNAVLPTSPAHIFHSDGQKALAPGEKIEFVMGFDKMKVGEQIPVIINVDPTSGMKESNKTNNIVKEFIDITEN